MLMEKTELMSKTRIIAYENLLRETFMYKELD